jgi:hypothetical protein
MARTAKLSNRLGAIRLLGGMGDNPAVDVGLRPLLDDDDLDIRLTAYEMLRKRHDPTVEAVMVNDRFELDLVQSNRPLIYAAQTGAPRLAVFGTDVRLRQPMLQSVWNGRLILRFEEGDARAKAFYRSGASERPRVEECRPEAGEFIRFLARTPSPSLGTPGLDLTYGETLSVLYELSREHNLGSEFRGEQDRILAAIMREDKDVEAAERADFPEDKPAQPGADAPTAPKPAAAPAPGLDARPKAADTVPR